MQGIAGRYNEPKQRKMGNSQTVYETAGSTSNGRIKSDDDEFDSPIASLTKQQIEEKFVEIVVSDCFVGVREVATASSAMASLVVSPHPFSYRQSVDSRIINYMD